MPGFFLRFLVSALGLALAAAVAPGMQIAGLGGLRVAAWYVGPSGRVEILIVRRDEA